MYLHIGEDVLVKTAEIVTILDKKLLDSSPILTEFLQKKEKITFSLTKNSIKSIVVTTKYVYYSPLSSVTLTKRSQQYSLTVEK